MRPLKQNKIGLLLTAVALSGFLMTGCDRKPKTRPSAPVPEVSTVTIQTRPLLLTTRLPGRTSAFRIAEIRPQVSGLVQKRLFTEGTDVKAGDVLYRIDAATFQTALINARAALGRSEASLPAVRARAERYKELLAERAVSQQDVDDTEAALKQLEADVAYWKASVETARINLAYTRVTAPISGRIGRSGVTEGAIVTAYQPAALATIQQLDPIYVDVPQSTTDLLSLKRHLEDGRLSQNGHGQKKVKLLLEDGSAYPLEGTLQYRDVTVDPTTGSVTLRVVVPNPDGLLLPGMFVRAVIKEGVLARAILIPQQAVSRDPKGNPVAMIVDPQDKVQMRMLTLDRAVDDQWLVSAGLSPGERVIVEGLQKVRPGMTVRVIASAQGAPASGKPAPNGAQASPQAN